MLEIKNNRPLRFRVLKDDSLGYKFMSREECGWCAGTWTTAGETIFNTSDISTDMANYLVKSGTQILRDSIKQGFQRYKLAHADRDVVVKFIFANGFVTEPITTLDIEAVDSIIPESFTTALLTTVEFVCYETL